MMMGAAQVTCHEGMYVNVCHRADGNLERMATLIQ
jgi:hypothetical protein